MKNREVRFKPLKTNPNQAPGQHNPNFATDSTKEKAKNYSFGGNKTDRFKISPELKMKKDWPGMTKYFPEKADKVLTLGARKSYR